MKKQLGVMTLDAALALARGKGMDLIEVVPTATPPVCRIGEYGKYLYEESKRAKEAHSRQSASKMKELQISASIDPHDFGVKLNHAIQFLCDDMKVRVKLRFKGRQKAHKEIGFGVVNKFVQDIAAFGQADSPPKMLGDRDLNVVISPLPRNRRAKNPRAVIAELHQPDEPDEPDDQEELSQTPTQSAEPPEVAPPAS
jgi:translation initiation factor IF-3